MCVKGPVSKISEDNVHRDTGCFSSVTKIAGFTMVLEILFNVSHFAGKLKYFFYRHEETCTSKRKYKLDFSILSKIIPIPLCNSVTRF
jgi:hypothetical protein